MDYKSKTYSLQAKTGSLTLQHLSHFEEEVYTMESLLRLPAAPSQLWRETLLYYFSKAFNQAGGGSLFLEEKFTGAAIYVNNLKITSIFEFEELPIT